jgi:hypothetical protein
MQSSAFLSGERSMAREALLEALSGLDRMLEGALQLAPSVYGWEPGATQFRGLYVTHADAERLLSRSAGGSAFGELEGQPFFAIEDVPTLSTLAERYGLSWFDCAIVLIALAPEIDQRYERLYAYLQDDVSRRRPSVDLILNLLCPTAGERLESRSHFAADSPLGRQRLIQLIADGNQNRPPLPALSVKLDEQVVRLLLDSDDLDQRLTGLCESTTSDADLAGLPLEQETVDGLRHIAMDARRGGSLRLWLAGPAMPVKQRVAAAMASTMGRPMMTFDPRLAGSNAPDLAVIVVREAQINNAVLHFDSDGFDDGVMQALAHAIASQNADVIVSSTAVPAALQKLAMTAVDFPRPSYETRREQWRRSLAAARIEITDEELDSLAGRFRLYPDEICAAVESAGIRAVWRGVRRTSAGDLSAAARSLSGRQIGAMARKIEPSYSWADIVLPDGTMGQLRAICSRVVHQHRVLDEWGFEKKLSMGKGVTALFAGPSGAGKTMAAEVIANALDIDLYKIDLSGIVSKYIGETEKNLDRVFTAAENANAILFFDEADALFGKRSEVKDSHDRYANIEISYLLQKMEMYDGVAILATNLRQNLDEAFLRRLAFTIHFPFPDERDRLRIWKSIWPAAVPMEEEIDFAFLSSQFKLSGGNIKNVALAAAFLAAEEESAVAMRHLVKAVVSEYQKLGKPLAKEIFGPYAGALS